MKSIHVWFATGLTVMLTGCGHDRSPAPDDNRPVTEVETIAVHLQRTPDIHEVVGTVQPTVGATVAAKVMAVIEAIPVAPGDSVAAGQLLAELDARELRAAFAKAQADYDRYEALLKKEAVTRAEFEAVEARFRAAEAALSDAAIVAPFTGVVARKLCAVGDLATPGQPLFVVEQTGAYRLETHVPERLAGHATTGKSVHVLVDATGEKCVGTVGEVDPAVDPATRTVLVKIDLACRQPLRSGLFGRAQLLIGERPALFVPKTAVHERGQLTYVYCAANGRAQMRLIKTGVTYLDAVEVVSGIEPGENVILAGAVTDGQRIE